MAAVAHGWVLDTVGFGNCGQPMLCNAGLFSPLLAYETQGLVSPVDQSTTTVSPTLLWLRANHKQPQAVLVHGLRKTVYTANHRVRLLVTPSATLRLPLEWFNPFVGVSPKPIHFRNGLGGLRGRHNNSWFSPTNTPVGSGVFFGSTAQTFSSPPGLPKSFAWYRSPLRRIGAKPP